METIKTLLFVIAVTGSVLAGLQIYKLHSDHVAAQEAQIARSRIVICEELIKLGRVCDYRKGY